MVSTRNKAQKETKGPHARSVTTPSPPQRRHGTPKTTTTAPSLFLLFKLIHLSNLPRFLRGKKETAMTKNHYTKEGKKKEKKTANITVERCYLPSLSSNLRTSLAPSSQCADLCCDVRFCSHSFVVARSEGGTRGGDDDAQGNPNTRTYLTSYLLTLVFSTYHMVFFPTY